MAFEVKVYREVTAYQAKVLFGMTWRQLGVALVGVPLIAGAFAICFLLGQEDLGVVLTVLLTVPFVAVGWLRPMGIGFEKYARYVWESRQGPKIFTFVQHDPWFQGKDKRDVEALSRSTRRSRRRYAAFEATN